MSDYMEKFRLDKKTAFVIGGLGLIGKEVSTAFAMAGAKTFVIDIESKQGHFFEMEMGKKGYETKRTILNRTPR